MQDTHQKPAPLQGHFPLLKHLLTETSSDALVPMLGARQRWLLLLEICLGHSRVRGGRSRDYPFSRQRANSLELANALQQTKMPFQPGRKPISVEISWFNVLVCLLLAETAKAEQHRTALSKELYYTAALEVIIDCLVEPAQQQTALDLLGVSHQGQERSRKFRTLFRREGLRAAQIMASLSAMRATHPEYSANDLPPLLGLQPQLLDTLTTCKVDLLYLKVKKAQTFLSACTKPFIQRGASAWCSQMAARMRDLLAEESAQYGFEPALLIDNDAVTILAFPQGGAISGPAISNAATRFFLDPDSPEHLSSSLIRTFYPRLAPYYEAARKEQLATAQILPLMGTEHRKGLSLFQLATANLLPGQNHINIPGVDSEDTLIDLQFKSTPSRHPCSGHRLSAAFTNSENQIPIWYNPSGRQAYGFASTAFSLAEITFSRMTGQAIYERLRDEHQLPVTRPETRRDLIRALPYADNRITYLKYDGDSVGQRFSALPLCERPELSTQLESLLRKSWLEALTNLIKAHNLTAGPVDLLYLGGDDLLLALPGALAEQYTELLDAALIKYSGANPIQFTFTAITEPVPETANHGSEEGGPSPAHNIMAVNESLDWVKVLKKAGQLHEQFARHAPGPASARLDTIKHYTLSAGAFFTAEI